MRKASEAAKLAWTFPSLAFGTGAQRLCNEQ